MSRMDYLVSNIYFCKWENNDDEMTAGKKHGHTQALFSWEMRS